MSRRTGHARRALLAVFALAPASIAAFAPRAAAQMRASEHGSVSQTVDGTEITVEYYRPVARGRDSLIGRVVKFGEMWTPGANWATTLEVSRDIHLDGKPLPRGTYSVWMIPRPGEWTVILARTARRFHLDRPPASDEQLRFAVKPLSGPHAEVLTWSFPVVNPDGATLQMQWGTWVVPLEIRVEPTRPALLTAEQRRRYAGSWLVRATGPGGDTTVSRLEVLETATGISGRAARPFWEGVDRDFDLFSAGPGRFRVGIRQGGKPFDTEEMYIRFTPADERATVVELTDDEGHIWGRGEREP